ncbi:MAG: bifunctional adenosylcobinamide kinase/adenosylcobinamide-phosphate guanylyltransferase [Pseudomonadota bacterium]
MANPRPSLSLVLGGARSGKSRHAEALARASGLDLLYVATAQAYDDEMRARIAQHQADRANDGWTTVEEEHDLAGVVARHTEPACVVLIDCLTLWLSNRLLSKEGTEGASMEGEIDGLCAALDARQGPVICVSNEVGLGIVPETKLGRVFRDHQGKLNQQVAALADHVCFVAAGLPLTLKEVPHG